MGSLSDDVVDTDVLIVGAGPIGLNLAYQLRRFSMPPVAQAGVKPISVHIIEALPKPEQSIQGRAVTFWPRSMELLAQLGLGEPILQQCNTVRSSAAYDLDGNEVFDRAWSFVEDISDTRYRFASVLRQKFVEDIMRDKLAALGVEIMERHKFVDLAVDDSIPVGDCGRVKARIAINSDSELPASLYTVRCRYLIGCDGSRTVVRGAAGIESTGSRTEDKWVRVDGVLKSTTMPKSRSYGSLESPIYGNVLWIPLDHGATRIGFCLKNGRRKLYDSSISDSEVFAREAVLSVAPFQLEFERIDWASVYSVGQRLAKNMWAHQCIFLAGDAAHSHSSGAGQGMNTGTHDASNLGWKLALVLTGHLKHEVLGTYELERLPHVARLIKYDEDVSVLISGRLPDGWSGQSDPNIALGQLFKEAIGFNTGLAIGYQKGLGVWDDGLRPRNSSSQMSCTTATPGNRVPDVQLLSAALWAPCWLHEITPNIAQFYVLTILASTSDGSLRGYRDFGAELRREPRLGLSGYNTSSVATPSPQHEFPPGRREWPVKFISVLPAKSDSAYNVVGTDPIGSVYFDTDDKEVVRRYGLDADAGASFVLRPDGFIGAVLPIAAESAARIVEYLGELLN